MSKQTLGVLAWLSPTVLLAAAAAAGTGTQISEIRIDQTGTDNDEYIELVGSPGASLSGLSLIVIGDGAGGSGVIENIVSLDGLTIPADGHFLVVEMTFTLVPIAQADLVLAGNGLNFENQDSVTHLLVDDFTGKNAQDLDTNDDGVFDVEPWAEIIDCVALVPPVLTELVYCGTEVGPDGMFVPGHVFRCVPDGTWLIGPFDPASGLDTPGAMNGPCFEPPPVELSVGKSGPDVAVAGNTATYTITVSNFGTDAAADVVITDTLPEGLSFSSQMSPPGVMLDDNTAPDIVWSVNSVEPKAQLVITLVASIDGDVNGEIINQVAVTTTSDDDPADNDDSFSSVVNPFVEPPAGLSINEIRVDELGADNNEYLELRGTPGTSLTGLSYLVIGDGAAVDGSGVLEAVVSLNGLTIPADGLFLAVEDTFTLVPQANADLVLSAVANGLNFENLDHVTHLLVANFAGNTTTDLDTDDDGVLDVVAWTDVIDAVGLVAAQDPGDELAYGAALGFENVGPDGESVPAHVYRCAPPGDDWVIGPVDIAAGVDTPAAANPSCGPKPCPEDTNGDGNVDVQDLVAVIVAWGTDDPDADVDGSGTVDVNDLVAVIIAWGPC